MALQERTGTRGKELGHGIQFELESDDRGAPEQVALARSQAIEPHREEARERGGDSPYGPVVEGDVQLFGEERIPVRDLDDPAPVIRHDRASAVDDEALDVGGRERLELHQVGGFPLGSSLDQVGTGKAQEEDSPARLFRDVVDEIEERRLGPMEVLEHDDEGAPGSKGLEEATDRREQDR